MLCRCHFKNSIGCLHASCLRGGVVCCLVQCLHSSWLPYIAAGVIAMTFAPPPNLYRLVPIGKKICSFSSLLRLPWKLLNQVSPYNVLLAPLSRTPLLLDSSTREQNVDESSFSVWYNTDSL